MRIFHIVCTNAVHRAWNLFLFSRRLVSLFDCPHFCGLKKKLHWRKGAWIIRTRGSNNSEVPFLAEKVHLLWSFFLAKAVPTGSKSLCTYGYSQYTGLTHPQSDWHEGLSGTVLHMARWEWDQYAIKTIYRGLHDISYSCILYLFDFILFYLFLAHLKAATITELKIAG